MQLYRKKTEELINDSLERYAPTKKVEIRGIQVEVPSFVSCLSNKDYNKKYGTQLKDAPIMNKEVRFAEENEPELFAKKLEMTAEINRIRAENYYELYQPQYEQALKKQSQLVREKKQEEEKKLQQNQDSSKGYDRGPGFG